MKIAIAGTGYVGLSNDVPNTYADVTHGHLLKSLELQEVPRWLAVSVEFADSDMPIFHMRAIDGGRRPDVTCVPKGRKSWGLQG